MGLVLYKHMEDVSKLDGIHIVLTLAFQACDLLHISNQLKDYCRLKNAKENSGSKLENLRFT
jgi:hypothetical protein